MPRDSPSPSELLSLVITEIHQRFGPDTKLDESLRRYRRYVAETTGKSSEPVDIEQFRAFLDHEHILGLRGSDTWSSEGNEDQLMLRWSIGSVLHRATPPLGRLPSQYLTFARQTRPRDCIVTFNYDLVLESVRGGASVLYRRFPSRYISDRDAEWTCSHGSIDWVDRKAFDESLQVLARSGSDDLFRRRNLLFGDAPITGIHRLVEGPRPKRDSLNSVFVVEDLDACYGERNMWYHAAPIILAPSSVKLLYETLIREFWRGMPLYA